jgi:hypothetical protein
LRARVGAPMQKLPDVSQTEPPQRLRTVTQRTQSLRTSIHR